jgi:hypothetical protein
MTLTEPKLCSPFKPIYAFADSRLLFWRNADGTPFLREIITNCDKARPSVAYVGASNGDDVHIYREIFEEAIAQVDVGVCRRIVACPPEDEVSFLNEADIVFLAGGSVEKGWRAFEQSGLGAAIQARYLAGALLVGVSAGAVQLGRGGLSDDGAQLVSTFGFLPFYIGAHDEADDWDGLHRVLRFAPDARHGIGIPSGGGIIYHGGELEPVCQPAREIFWEEGEERQRILLPAGR